MQLCILLYDERVTTHKRMQEINNIIDEQPHFAREQVELHIRNQNAHKELKSYNDTHSFLNIHDLTIKSTITRTLKEEMRLLQLNNPDAFLNEITNTEQNIRRINSQIQNKKYKSNKELESWNENLKNALNKREILKELATGNPAF